MLTHVFDMYFLRKIPFIISFLFLFHNLSFAAENELKQMSVSYKDWRNTFLTFEFKSAPRYEIVENFKHRVLTIKFRNTKPNELYNSLVFDGSIISASKIEKVSPTEFWVKVKTRFNDVEYTVLPRQKNSNKLVIKFSKLPSKKEKYDSNVVLKIGRKQSDELEQVIFTLNRRVQYKVTEMFSPSYRISIRLYDTRILPDLQFPLMLSSFIKEVLILEVKGDIILTFEPLNEGIELKTNYLTDPIQLVMKVSPVALSAMAKRERLKEKQTISKNELSTLEAKIKFQQQFNEAERNYRKGYFSKSGLEFKNVYNRTPFSRIGVRSYFRAADSYFQRADNKKNGNYLFAIQEYNAAINASKAAGLELSDTVRAFYNIARSYDKLNFYDEAFNYYKQLRRDFHDSIYTKEALFRIGNLEQSRGNHENAIKYLTQFVAEDPNSHLKPVALYKLGIAFFQKKDFIEAKKFLDEVRSIDPGYWKKNPTSMFAMGEVYFENQDFHVARSVYEALIELYPESKFSHLAAIRIGDFLREEGQDEIAIQAYEKAVKAYPKEIKYVGKMRIANIYASLPGENNFKKAQEIYDFIIAQGIKPEMVEEAYLRKGLVLTLFSKYELAIKTLKEFAIKYPENIYVRGKIIEDKINKNAFSSIKSYYREGKYFEALDIMEKHLPPQVLGFPKGTPKFVLGDSYYKLGLLEAALKVFDHIILNDKDDYFVANSLYLKGKIHTSMDQPIQAQEAYLEFIKKFKDHSYKPSVKLELAKSYEKNQQLELARRTLKQIIKDYEDTLNPLQQEVVPQAWFELGKIFQDLGQYEKAMTSYQNVLGKFRHPIADEKVAGYVKDSGFLIGDMLFELNQQDAAIKTYNSAIGLYPNSEKSPWAKYQIGQIYLKQSQKEKALDVFAKLIQESKNQPDALWGQLAKETHKSISNELKFNDYLNRIPSAADTTL